MPLRGARVILTVLALTGCTSTTEPRQEMEVSVALGSGVIRSGEHIEVTVTAINRGTRSVTINGNPCRGVHGSFVVTNIDGDVVGPGEQLCTLVAVSKEILPGEKIVFQARWDGDSQQGRIGAPPVFLEPGEYQVRGQILTLSGRVVGAPVSVRVIAPQSRWELPEAHQPPGCTFRDLVLRQRHKVDVAGP